MCSPLSCGTHGLELVACVLWHISVVACGIPMLLVAVVACGMCSAVAVNFICLAVASSTCGCLLLRSNGEPDNIESNFLCQTLLIVCISLNGL